MYHACALLISGKGFVLEKQTPFMNPGPLLPYVIFITLQKQHSSCILSGYHTKIYMFKVCNYTDSASKVA